MVKGEAANSEGGVIFPRRPAAPREIDRANNGNGIVLSERLKHPKGVVYRHKANGIGFVSAATAKPCGYLNAGKLAPIKTEPRIFSKSRCNGVTKSQSDPP